MLKLKIEQEIAISGFIKNQIKIKKAISITVYVCQQIFIIN